MTMLPTLVVLASSLYCGSSLKLVMRSSPVPQSPLEPFQLKRPMLSLLTASSAALILTARPSLAQAQSVEEVNKILSGYSLPPVLYVPPGFSPLVSEFGRGNIKKGLENQNPILVQFCYPSLWVVQRTSVNNNGEAGTIAANDYIKGDSAFLYVIPAPEGESLSPSSKALVQKILLKCKA